MVKRSEFTINRNNARYCRPRDGERLIPRNLGVVMLRSKDLVDGAVFPQNYDQGLDFAIFKQEVMVSILNADIVLYNSGATVKLVKSSYR